MVPVSHQLICSESRKFVCTVAKSGIRDGETYLAEDLKPVGVFYEGVVGDATAVVERLTAETATSFGTRRSRQLQLSRAGKDNIPIKNQDDEVSYTRCTG